VATLVESRKSELRVIYCHCAAELAKGEGAKTPTCTASLCRVPNFENPPTPPNGFIPNPGDWIQPDKLKPYTKKQATSSGTPIVVDETDIEDSSESSEVEYDEWNGFDEAEEVTE